MAFRPGNREKGWNDPPEFLHSAQEASSNNVPKKTLLNQRVSHTLADLNQPKSTESETVLSEPPKMSAPPLVSDVKISKDNQEETSQTSLNKESFSLETIEKIFDLKIQYLKENQVPIRTCDDIIKRVKVFSSSWSKLNEKVQEKMSNLAKALNEDDLKTANEIHVKLILDFPSEVTQWMVGIKKIIYELTELKYKQEEPKADEKPIEEEALTNKTNENL